MIHTAAGAHAGVVDQDVEPAEAAHRGVDRCLPVGFARHVEAHEKRFADGGADVALERPAFRLQDVADDNPRPLPREEARLDGAHPPGATADQRDLSGQPHPARTRARFRRAFNRAAGPAIVRPLV